MQARRSLNEDQVGEAIEDWIAPRKKGRLDSARSACPRRAVEKVRGLLQADNKKTQRSWIDVARVALVTSPNTVSWPH